MPARPEGQARTREASRRGSVLKVRAAQLIYVRAIPFPDGNARNFLLIPRPGERQTPLFRFPTLESILIYGYHSRSD